MESGQNWHQIGNKAFYILKVSKFYIKKMISMLAGLKVPLCCVNVYFTGQNKMQRGDPMELNFEGLEIQK